MRIKFKSNKSRELFFKNIRSRISSWKEFYQLFKISRKTLDTYKSGKYTIPLVFLDKVCAHFDIASENTEKIEDNWGRIRGGQSAYNLNKKYFDFGRNKAIAATKEKANKIDPNISLTGDLAYFIGLFIGDGFANKYNHTYFVQFTGHISEREYYTNIISPIFERELNLIPTILKHKYSNAIRINANYRDLFLLITQRFKISAGRKSYSVLIPKEIEESPFVLDCIAGIFDAEGCFYIDNRTTYKKGYPRIDLHMNNPGIIKQISEIFTQNKINHSVSKNYGNILIYGNGNIIDFCKKVHLKNPKIKDGLDNLIANGYN